MLGASAEEIAAIEATLAAEADDAIFEVWPENWEAVCAFLSVSTQWRMVAIVTQIGGQTYYQGLDYAGVEAGLRGAAIATTPALWSDLRTIEAAARDALNGQPDPDGPGHD